MITGHLSKDMRRTTKTAKTVVHAIAHCSQCGWNDEDYQYAARRGAAHARKTGHTVAVELGVHYEVKPKE